MINLSIIDCKKTEFGISYKGFDAMSDEIYFDHPTFHPEMCREHCLKSNASHFEWKWNPEAKDGSCVCKASDAGRVPQKGNE